MIQIGRMKKMPEYDVTIKGSVTKTYRIEADNEDEAIELAHEGFSVAYEEGIEEDYNQETISAVDILEDEE